MPGDCYYCGRLLSEPSKGTCPGKHAPLKGSAMTDEQFAGVVAKLEPDSLRGEYDPTVYLPFPIETTLYTRLLIAAGKRGESLRDLVERALVYEVGDPEGASRGSIFFQSKQAIEPGCSVTVYGDSPISLKPLEFICDVPGLQIMSMLYGCTEQWPFFTLPFDGVPSEFFARGAAGSSVRTFEYDAVGGGYPITLRIENRGTMPRRFEAILLGRRPPMVTR
jgi:hypothetical protein